MLEPSQSTQIGRAFPFHTQLLVNRTPNMQAATMGGDGDYSNLYKSVYVTLDASNHDTGTSRARRTSILNGGTDMALPDEIPFLHILGGSFKNLDFDIVGKSNGGNLKKSKVTKKAIKKKTLNANQQLQLDFLKLLNFPEPSKGCSELDLPTVIKLMDNMPSLANEKFLFTAFSEPLTALHMLCAIDAPLKCIKRCFQHNGNAVLDASSTIGSPIHYACLYRANVKTVRYICSNVEDPVAVLSIVNRAKRTALHIACLSKESLELVQLLTSACPNAARMADKDGMTPLHLALTMRIPDLEVIEDLTEVCPKALCMAENSTGSTPLHLALKNENVGIDIVKDLVVTHPRACKLVDASGNTPLHIAVQNGRDLSVIKFLLKKHLDAINLPNKEGETPYSIGKASRRVNKDVLKMLKPTTVVTIV